MTCSHPHVRCDACGQRVNDRVRVAHLEAALDWIVNEMSALTRENFGPLMERALAKGAAHIEHKSRLRSVDALP